MVPIRIDIKSFDKKEVFFIFLREWEKLDDLFFIASPIIFPIQKTLGGNFFRGTNTTIMTVKLCYLQNAYN